MNFIKLPRDKAMVLFNNFIEAGKAEYDKTIKDDYLKLRKDILTMVSSIKGKEYQFDLPLALSFYEYTMSNMPGFNEAVAADNDFWRYVCCCVVPDVIQARHGLVNTYYYQKTYRIYFQALWWYIHLSWQGSIEATKEALKPLNTDYIQALVERSGKDGLYLEVSREIMRQLALLPTEVRNKQMDDKNLFRRVMIQNTAKNGCFNLIFEGKAKEYVYLLYKACGVEVKDYERN